MSDTCACVCVPASLLFFSFSSFFFPFRGIVITVLWPNSLCAPLQQVAVSPSCTRLKVRFEPTRGVWTLQPACFGFESMVATSSTELDRDAPDIDIFIFGNKIEICIFDVSILPLTIYQYLQLHVLSKKRWFNIL